MGSTMAGMMGRGMGGMGGLEQGEPMQNSRFRVAKGRILKQRGRAAPSVLRTGGLMRNCLFASGSL